MEVAIEQHVRSREKLIPRQRSGLVTRAKTSRSDPPASPGPALAANLPFALDRRHRSDDTCAARSSDTD